MLVKFLFMLIMPVVLMAGVGVRVMPVRAAEYAAGLHPLARLLLQRRHAVEHAQDGHIAVQPVRHGVEPCLALPAVCDQQRAVLQQQHILRRRLIAVRFRPRRDEQRHLGALPGDLPGEVIRGKYRRRDAEPGVSAVLRRGGRAGVKRRHKQYYKTYRDKFPHFIPRFPDYDTTHA